MGIYKHTPIDLDGPALRLVRLLKGNCSDQIHCEIFDAFLSDSVTDMIPYEALSYTWGSLEDPLEITINGAQMSVTSNLHSALRHLRFEEIDRIVWVDAICINQDDVLERGHQVKQMGNIYRKAGQVIIWLGESTKATDLAMKSLKRLHEDLRKWSGLGQLWVKDELSNRHSINAAFQDWQSLHHTGSVASFRLEEERKGLEALLRRSWFRRVWVLQEVANAKYATVVCGSKSISAATFAIFPSLRKIPIDSHCSAVLEIMPGISRKQSWWNEKRDLQTLLSKFGGAEATDSRDRVFALLGISSDACQSQRLYADYSKSTQDVIRDCIQFFIPFGRADKALGDQLPSTMSKFFQFLPRMTENVFEQALRQGKDGLLISYLISREGVDVNIGRNFTGRVFSRKVLEKPLIWGAKNGNMLAVELLLGREDIDVNAVDESAKTALHFAARNGHAAIVKQLIEHGAETQTMTGAKRTPFHDAASRGHHDVMRIFIDKNVDVRTRDDSTATALHYAASNGKDETVRLLLQSGLDVNIAASHQSTALHWAAFHGHESTISLLLNAGANPDLEIICDEQAKWVWKYNTVGEMQKMNKDLEAEPEYAAWEASTSGHENFRNSCPEDWKTKYTELLLGKTEEGNITAQEGWTALDIAAHQALVTRNDRTRNQSYQIILLLRSKMKSTKSELYGNDVPNQRKMIMDTIKSVT